MPTRGEVDEPALCRGVTRRGTGAAPTTPQIDAMFTIEPRPRSAMPAPTSWARCHGATRSISTVAAKSSSVSSATGPALITPALFTSTSIGPTASAASRTNRQRASADERSATIAVIPGRSAASESSRSPWRAVATTRQPASASTAANRRPSPEDAPVTRAVRPWRSKMAAGPEAALMPILIAFARLRGEAGGTDCRS